MGGGEILYTLHRAELCTQGERRSRLPSSSLKTNRYLGKRRITLLLHDADSSKEIWVEDRLVTLAIGLHDGNSRITLSDLFSMGTSSYSGAVTMYSKYLTVKESVQDIMKMKGVL